MFVSDCICILYGLSDLVKKEFIVEKVKKIRQYAWIVRDKKQPKNVAFHCLGYHRRNL